MGTRQRVRLSLPRLHSNCFRGRYKTLHLSAMGAAIPNLATLAVSLPSILPFAPDEIHTEILTGSVEVQDEIIPEDEDEDISYQTRAKSTLSVVIKIGEGDDETQRDVDQNVKEKSGTKTAKRVEGSNKKNTRGKGKEKAEQLVFQEPEQEDLDIP
jgi:ribonuclease P/MRP protein subunit RPP20